MQAVLAERASSSLERAIDISCYEIDAIDEFRDSPICRRRRYLAAD